MRRAHFFRTLLSTTKKITLKVHITIAHHIIRTTHSEQDSAAEYKFAKGRFNDILCFAAYATSVLQ